MTSENLDEIRKDIFDRLKTILLSLLKTMKEKDPSKRPVLDWGTDLQEDLGVDSLESLDVMNAIEEEFDVSPNLNEATSRRKISDIVDYIVELQEANKAKR